MKSKSVLVLLLFVAAAAFLVGRSTGRMAPSVRPELVEGRTVAQDRRVEGPAQPSKPVEPPTADDLKIWARHRAMRAEFSGFPDPKRMAKMSEEERAAELRMLQSAQQQHEADAMARLHQELPDVKGTDLPLVLRRVQEFIAAITPRYYKLQEEEIARLQAAGAFSDAALPLIKEEVLNRLAEEFPGVGPAGIRQLLGLKEASQD